jgi:hypothetical protein
MPTLTGWQNLAPTWTLLGPTWTDIFVVTDWTPEPQVTLDGIDYTANTIGNVSIRRGRDTVYAQVQAGYATVELIDVNGLIQPKVGQTLVVSARDAYNVQTPLFTGQVSDWDTETVAVQDGVLVHLPDAGCRTARTAEPAHHPGRRTPIRARRRTCRRRRRGRPVLGVGGSCRNGGRGGRSVLR